MAADKVPVAQYVWLLNLADVCAGVAAYRTRNYKSYGRRQRAIRDHIHELLLEVAEDPGVLQPDAEFRERVERIAAAVDAMPPEGG